MQNQQNLTFYREKAFFVIKLKNWRLKMRQTYKPQWEIKREKREKWEKTGIVSYKEGDPHLTFSIENNISRLLKQSNGDNSFYFLAILSFIEGFLRDKYKTDFPEFDFDKPRKKDEPHFGLTKMIEIVEKENPQAKKSLSSFYFFERHHSGEYKNEISGKIEKEYFVSGDRIRHCFALQDDKNLQVLITTFAQFAKDFGFYENNKENINKLLDDNHFADMKNQKSSDNEKMAEIGISLLKKLNNKSAEKSEKAEAKKEFQEFQDANTLYAKSWRDYQQIMSTLTDEQKSISDEILEVIRKNGKISRLIKGGPGTGKTLILINLLQQNLDKNILLLTYTNSLTNYNKFLANLVCFNGHKLSDDEKEKINKKILRFDDYFSGLAGKILNKKIVQLNDFNSEKLENICVKFGLEKAELLREASEIWLHLPSEREYISLTYVQKTLVSDDTKNKREKIWEAGLELQKAIDFESECPIEYAFYKIQDAATTVPENLRSDYLFIDEIQDLEAAKIESIKKISRKGFIFTGDLTQSVFVRKGLPWSWLRKKGIPVSEKKLTQNFRSTKPIQDLSNKFRNLIRLKDTDTVSEGFMPGPIPEAYVSKSEEAAFDKIQELVQYYTESLYFDKKDICVVAPNNNILKSLEEKLKNTISIESENFDFYSTDDFIKLSRIKYIKGIDIPIVILILDKSFINTQTNDNLDSFAQENSIYTCISRAMNILNVFFIDEDGKLLSTPQEGQKENAVYKLFTAMDKNPKINLPE